MSDQSGRKNVTILGLPGAVSTAAYCMSAQAQPNLLLPVVDRYSQVIGAAVHQYSHVIRNLNPSLTAMIQLKPGIPPCLT